MPQLDDLAIQSPPRSRQAQNTHPAVVWGVLCAYILLALGSHWLIRAGHVRTSGGELSPDRAAFTAINALTLTGFNQDVGLDLSPFAPSGAPLLLLGLTLGGSLLALFGQSALAARVIGLPYTLKRIALATLAVTTLGTLIGAVALADRGPLQALLGGAGAIGNSGLFFGRLPGLQHWQTSVILIPLATAGGMGLLVWMDLFDRAIGASRRISRHSRATLASLAAAYLLGASALLAAQAGSNPAYSWRYRAAAASVEAINTRSPGYALEYLYANPRPVIWVMAILMLVGAGSASTAGGLKVTTFWRLGRGVIDCLCGRSVGRGAAIAAIWTAGFLGVTFLGFLLLLASAPHVAADQLLFLSISAACNVGLAYDPISIVGPGLWILCGLMLFGRLAPLAILWWLARADDDAAVAFA